MADEAIDYVNRTNALSPDTPFFVKFAPGATHAPHHPTPEWVKKISDLHLFDQGWNKLRDTIFENQTRLGVIPQNSATFLHDRPVPLRPRPNIGRPSGLIHRSRLPPSIFPISTGNLAATVTANAFFAKPCPTRGRLPHFTMHSASCSCAKSAPMRRSVNCVKQQSWTPVNRAMLTSMPWG
ncbi:hypothetical protein XI09_04425 [Bradyrhizobium sp. CCBAU 11386]|nr:hypothetical protein [Bradyrhizobium sp. CCBAU 11386]